MNLRKATLIYAFGKYSKVIMQILVSAFLSRLLTPYDYGIVAIISVFSAFFSAFSDMGFGVAIVQKQDLSQSQINDIFTFTFYFSIIIAIIFGFFSYLIAAFYNNSVYIPLGWLLSLSLFFNSLNMVPNGLMNKNQLFIKISIRTVIAYFVSAVIAIFLAFAGFRYYALVVQSIIAAFITLIWNLWNSNLKFKVNMNLKSVKIISSYSGYQFAFNIVNYISGNLDSILTGKFFGSSQLGFYNKANNLTLYPVDNLSGIISPVLHPILARFQEKPIIIYNKYLNVYKVLALVGIFCSAFCYLGAREIVIIFYGGQWLSTIPCFKILSIAIFARMINSSCGAIFQVLNNTRLLFYNGILNSILTVIGILLGVFFGRSIYNLSIFVSTSFIIQYFTAFYMLICMGFKYKISKFIYDTYKYIILFCIVALAVIIYPFNIAGLLLSVVIKFLYLGLVIIISLFILREEKIIRIILH